jgi:uncharacterized membrane protein YhaH (DUF805 family)
MNSSTYEFDGRVLRSIRFFVLIVFLGILLFLPIVYAAIPGSTDESGSLPPLLLLAAVSALVFPAAALLVPRRVAASTMRRVFDRSWSDEVEDVDDASIPIPRTPREYLATTYFWSTAMQVALLSAPAFFAAVVYMVHRRTWLLGVAIAMLFLVAMRRPTRKGLDQWVERCESLDSMGTTRPRKGA